MARYKSDQNQLEKNGPGTLIEFMPDPNKNINEQVTDANSKIMEMHKEIVNLYLKIKRCSKDVNLTES